MTRTWLWSQLISVTYVYVYVNHSSRRIRKIKKQPTKSTSVQKIVTHNQCAKYNTTFTFFQNAYRVGVNRWFYAASRGFDTAFSSLDHHSLTQASTIRYKSFFWRYSLRLKDEMKTASRKTKRRSPRTEFSNFIVFFFHKALLDWNGLELICEGIRNPILGSFVIYLFLSTRD